MILALVAGCAPLIAGASPVPLGAGHGELGLIAHGGHVPVHVEDGLNRRRAYPTAGVTTFGRFQLRENLGLGGRIDLGPTQYIAGGGWLSLRVFGDRDHYVGVQLEGGWAYGELSIPAAFRMGERVWFWARPSARIALVPMGMLPIGVSVDIGESLRLQAEVVPMAPIFIDGWQRANPIGGTVGLGFTNRF